MTRTGPSTLMSLSLVSGRTCTDGRQGERGFESGRRGHQTLWSSADDDEGEEGRGSPGGHPRSVACRSTEGDQVPSGPEARLGTALVVVFSDPMVERHVRDRRAHGRAGLLRPASYLAPLARTRLNCSRPRCARAGRRPQTSISISFAALRAQGAACMNNTFALGYFYGPRLCQGIAWQYTARAQASCASSSPWPVYRAQGTLTPIDAALILAIYRRPVVVAGLEATVHALGVLFAGKFDYTEVVARSLDIRRSASVMSADGM